MAAHEKDQALRLLPISYRKWLRRWPLLIVTPYLLCLGVGAIAAAGHNLPWSTLAMAVIFDRIYGAVGIFLAIASIEFIRAIKAMPKAIDAIASTSATPEDTAALSALLEQYSKRLESRWRVAALLIGVTGAIVLVVGVLISPYGPVLMKKASSDPAYAIFWTTKWLLSPMIWGYGVGLALWYSLVTTMLLWRIGRTVTLAPRLGHEDNCGGLGSVGTLSILNSAPFIVAAAFLAAIAFGFNGLYGPAVPVRWVAEYFLVIVALPLALLSLLLPIVSIHRALLKAREIRMTLFSPLLSAALSRANEKLRDRTGTYDSSKVELEVLALIGPKQLPSPLWPIDLKLLGLIATPQIGTIFLAVAKWIKLASVQ